MATKARTVRVDDNLWLVAGIIAKLQGATLSDQIREDLLARVAVAVADPMTFLRLSGQGPAVQRMAAELAALASAGPVADRLTDLDERLQAVEAAVGARSTEETA